MTSAVIIFIREVLEAVLIICILLAASSSLSLKKRWVLYSIALGALCAGIYAFFFDTVTDMFEGVGQEVVNAILLMTITLSLLGFNTFVVSRIRRTSIRISDKIAITALVVAICMAITREGAEIYIYLSGYLAMPDRLPPILLGGILGTGIGLSTGAIIYFAIMSLDWARRLYVSCIVLIPVAAGLASQAVNNLMQADILNSQMPLWDSSSIVPEGSVIGELLYALFSYEATPTPSQVAVYTGVAVLMVASMVSLVMLSEKK